MSENRCQAACRHRVAPSIGAKFSIAWGLVVFLASGVCLLPARLAADPPPAGDISLAGKARSVTDLTIAATAGVVVSCERTKDASSGAPLLRLTFKKTGPERRMVAVQGTPAGPLGTTKALAVSYRLQLDEAATASLTLLAFERDGGVWYRSGPIAPSPDRFVDARLPLPQDFTRAEFATDADGTMHWEQVERVWLGLLLDGPASGFWDLKRAVLTSQPFCPTVPAPVTGKWSSAADSAVQGTIAQVKDGPGGSSCMKYTFQMPGRASHVCHSPAARRHRRVGRLLRSAFHLPGQSSQRHFRTPGDAP